MCIKVTGKIENIGTRTGDVGYLLALEEACFILVKFAKSKLWDGGFAALQEYDHIRSAYTSITKIEWGKE